jgi:DNA-binding NarL/FixJ family response regulator
MCRVLLLDGDRVSLKAMQCLLSRATYDVAGTEYGRSGLHLLSDFDPDVVVIDLLLKDMSGLDALRAVRQAGHRSPCILITRFGHDQDREEAMRLGVFDCIEQPLSAGLILAVVHNAAAGHTEASAREESHALARWADVVVRGARSPRDMPTLHEWGRAVAVSRGGLRNWCYTARVSPRLSLQFTRILRAVTKQQTSPSSSAPEDLLDIVDRRTLTKLLIRAGGTPTALPATVAQFLERQRLIENHKAVATVRVALELGESTSFHAQQRPQLAMTAIRSRKRTIA